MDLKSSFPKFAKKIRIGKTSNGGQSPLQTCEEPIVEKTSHQETEIDGARLVNMFPEMLNINSKVDMQLITVRPELLDSLLYGNLGNGKVVPSQKANVVKCSKPPKGRGIGSSKKETHEQKEASNKKGSELQVKILKMLVY